MKNLLNILIPVFITAGFISANLPSSGAIHDSENIYAVTSSDTTAKYNLQVRPFNLPIVSPSSGIQFYRNGIIFLAHSKGEEKMSQKHLSFGSVKPFMALVADTLPGQYMPFMTATSTIFPVEATTFSKDFNTMYLSLIPDNESREKIFSASYTQNGWVIDNRPLGFCNVNYLFTHPALSKNGDFMIFSSDLKGSYGGLDLYISRKTDDRWGVPENLGPQINTSGNELFASLDGGNNLYFSSDRLPGNGGYDVFVCTYDGKNWGKPFNLPAEINTPDDEVAFIINREDGKSAFFTSRGKSGKATMQLFRVTLNPSRNIGVATNLSEQILAMAGIEGHIQTDKTAVSEPVALIVPEEPEQETKVETQPKAAEEKIAAKAAEETKPLPEIAPGPAKKRDVLIYRIQYAANTKPVGSQKVTVAGRTYNSYEYLYKGGYRSAIGEFHTLAEATRFLNTCRQAGYNQAFLAAFKNDERITDSEARILEAQLAGTENEKVPAASAPDKINEISTEAVTHSSESLSKTEGIKYRVQILSNTKPLGSYEITVAGKSYETFEYLYMGSYRTAVGEFATLSQAVNFQKICRASGYDQAFVVAFKDNVRTNDPALFK